MMRKKMTGKAVALLLAMVMIVSLLPTTVFAAETDEFTVVVSMVCMWSPKPTPWMKLTP